MPKPFKIQEPIPLVSLTCPDATATDPWSFVTGTGAGWNIITNNNQTIIANYDAEIDYSGLWLQKLTAYVDMINETESLPPSILMMNNDQALIICTLISTTPFEAAVPTSMVAGYPQTSDDINQLMYRRVRGLQANTSNTPLGGSGLPHTLWDTTIAGTNAFAVDKLYLRKLVGLYSFGLPFNNGTEVAVYDSWVQGFGIQDKEPDPERFFRMQRNVRLFS